MVVESSDTKTLINWSCTDRFFYHFASKLLWKSLQITSSEVSDYIFNRKFSGSRVMGQYKSRKEMTRKDDKLVLFLANEAFRKNFGLRKRRFPNIQGRPTLLPSARVTHLSLDMDIVEERHPFYLFGFPRRPLLTHSVMRAFISKLLSLMPKLTGLSLDGPLYRCELPQILSVQNLQSLELGYQAGRFETVDDDFVDEHVIDFGCLIVLKHLRSLSVGQLHRQEIDSLTKVIPRLPLTTLRLGTPKLDDDRYYYFVGWSSGHSSIRSFIEESLKLERSSEAGGRPLNSIAKLKTLELKEGANFHDTELNTLPTRAPMLFYDITDLSLLSMDLDYVDFVFRNYSFPSIQCLSIFGCSHFFSEENYLAMGFLKRAKRAKLDCDLRECKRGHERHRDPFKSFIARHQNTLRQIVIYPRWSYRTDGSECKPLKFFFDANVYKKLFGPDMEIRTGTEIGGQESPEVGDSRSEELDLKADPGRVADHDQQTSVYK